jgi:bifunctional NMN adenylyltransferase/nudix hydrolase
MPKYKNAIVIGRYQIYHKGHEQLIRKALEIADEVLIMIGSAMQSRNIRNPFNHSERAEMILSMLSESERARINFLPVRDYYDDSLWNADVQRQVARCVADSERIALVGFKKDDTYYLDNFPNWDALAIESNLDKDATDLRKLYFSAPTADIALAEMSDRISIQVSRLLKDFSQKTEYYELKNEYAKIEQDNQVYAGIPWDIISTTVDALVTINDHVLLGKRKHYPGKGLWAIPGGFLEKYETLLQGATRELKEETSLDVPDAELNKFLVKVKAFSHPRRSCRGRVITHVHHFALTGWSINSETWPSIEAADDLESVEWIPYSQISGMEEDLFEDHFAILSDFLR